MQRHKYKVGDVVRVIEVDPRDKGTPVKMGDIGKVVEIYPSDPSLLLVSFDLPFADHPVVRHGNWRALSYQLELVKGALTVDTCIALYRGACEQFEAAELALEKAKAAVQDARLNLRDALDGEA